MAKPARPERRRSPRARRPWPLEVKNGSGKLWRGRSVDVSAGGMRFQIDPPPLEVRGFMFIAFDPADSVGPLWTRFWVVRQIAPGEYAVRFLDLPPKNVERLNQLIVERPPAADETAAPPD